MRLGEGAELGESFNDINVFQTTIYYACRSRSCIVIGISPSINITLSLISLPSKNCAMMRHEQGDVGCKSIERGMPKAHIVSTAFVTDYISPLTGLAAWELRR